MTDVSILDYERDGVTPVQDHAEGIQRPRLHLLSATDLDLKPTEWLVHGYFEQQAVIFLYGDTRAFKTFLALDIACCVALGKSWGPGCAVRQGPVVYVCGEGRNGISRRLEAWSLHHNRPRPEQLYIASQSTDLGNDNALEELIAAIDHLPDPPSMIGFDTLARNYSGAENESVDIGAFYRRVEHYLIKPYDCSVLVTHHPGKDASRGARGSAAIKQNCDAMFQVERNDAGDQWFTQLHSEKMKDAPEPDDLTFEAKQYDLGIRDAEGQSVTSLALDYVTPAEVRLVEASRIKDREADDEKHKKELLQLIARDGGMTQQDYAARIGIDQSSISRIMKKLRNGDHLKGGSGNLKLTPAGRVYCGWQDLTEHI